MENCKEEMGLIRTVGTATAAAATALTVSYACASFSSASSSSSPSAQVPKTLNLSFLSPPHRSRLIGAAADPPAALKMDGPSTNHTSSSQNDAVSPELQTEFMVDMKCEGCVNAVKNKLETISGVKNVEVDLSNQVVRVLGSSPVKAMTDALEQTGRKARLIGQGVLEDFLVSAAVAEFKGPEIFGVVRFAQVNMELAQIEASFGGLSTGKHGWSINEFGDLTRGAASTGKVFTPTNQVTDEELLGDLGTLDVNENGEASFLGVKQNLRVGDLIGRALVVYGTEDKSDPGAAAAVIARSAGVGENYKRICLCDGTTIWESTNSDFVTSKV